MLALYPYARPLCPKSWMKGYTASKERIGPACHNFLHLKNNVPQHSITAKAKWQLHLFSALFCPLHSITNEQQCEISKVWWISVKASWHSHYIILLLCSHRIRSQRGKEFMCVLYRHISG